MSTKDNSGELSDVQLEAVTAGKGQPVINNFKKRRGDGVSSFAIARAFGGTKASVPTPGGSCGPNGCPA